MIRKILLLFAIAATVSYAQQVRGIDLHSSAKDTIDARAQAAIGANPGFTLNGSNQAVVQDTVADTTALKLVSGSGAKYLQQLAGWLVQRDSSYSEKTGQAYTTSENGKQWVRDIFLRNPNVYNVLDAGFDNTGTSDNSAKLEKLILNIDDSSTVYFPSGQFKISSQIDTIKKVIYFKGAGITQSIIDFGDIQSILRFGNSFLFEGFTVINSNNSLDCDPEFNTNGNTEFTIVRENRFYDCNQPVRIFPNHTDSTSHISSAIISNNIFENCSNGLLVNAKIKTLEISNNHFINQRDTTIASYCIYAGHSQNAADKREKIIIQGNVIDSMSCRYTSYGTYGIIVYGDNALVADNIIGPISIVGAGSGTGQFNLTQGLYIAGDNFIVSGNIFYNTSQTREANAGQDIYVKGDFTNGRHRYIIGNLFYSDRDSAGYSINMRTRASILNNAFIGLAENYVYTNTEIRPTVIDGGGGNYYFGYEDHSIEIAGNVVKSKRNFIALNSQNKPLRLIIKNNIANFIADSKSLVYSGYDTDLEYFEISGNHVTNGAIAALTAINIADEFIIKNNYCLTNGGAIDINAYSNVDIIGNTIISDTSAVISSGMIDIYQSSEIYNVNSIARIINNRMEMRHTTTAGYGFITIGTPNIYSNNNIFYIDTVATINVLQRGYFLQNLTGGFKYLEFIGDKFISAENEFNTAYNQASLNIDYIKIADCLFDSTVVYGFKNSASHTITTLILQNNTWHGTTDLLNKSGTITHLSKRQNWGDGIYNLFEYVDTDSLYKVIYDFDNTIQDTMGIKR